MKINATETGPKKHKIRLSIFKGRTDSFAIDEDKLELDMRRLVEAANCKFVKFESKKCKNDDGWLNYSIVITGIRNNLSLCHFGLEVYTYTWFSAKRISPPSILPLDELKARLNEYLNNSTNLKDQDLMSSIIVVED